MLYNTADAKQREAFEKRCADLAKKGTFVELTERTGRTLSQNAYLHLLIGIVAMEIGVTLDYAKQTYFKQVCNPDIFVIRKVDKFRGCVVTMLRSSAGVNKEDMAKAITRFKNWGRAEGIRMPDAEDKAILLEAERQMKASEFV